jgi:hypothetical protein
MPKRCQFHGISAVSVEARAQSRAAAIAGLLIFGVLAQAVALPAGMGRLTACSQPSREETDSRELPVNEEVAGACILTSSRPSRIEVTSAQAPTRGLAHNVKRAAGIFVGVSLPAEQARRNGTGGPLRC